MKLIEQIKKIIISLRYTFTRTHIKAIHEEDLCGLLKSLQIYDDIEHGKFTCMCCDEVITLDNIWGLVRKDGAIQVICSNPECISKLE
jgi:hypothetical protein